LRIVRPFLLEILPTSWALAAEITAGVASYAELKMLNGIFSHISHMKPSSVGWCV
jgi:hypothetical protein